MKENKILKKKNYPKQNVIDILVYIVVHIKWNQIHSNHLQIVDVQLLDNYFLQWSLQLQKFFHQLFLKILHILKHTQMML